jgi:hypothetical protein
MRVGLAPGEQDMCNRKRNGVACGAWGDAAEPRGQGEDAL